METIPEMISRFEREGDASLFNAIGVASRDNLTEAIEGAEAMSFGIPDSATELGRRVFKRINNEMHQLFCGTAKEDANQREALTKALKLDSSAVGVTVAAILVSMGFAVPVAAITSVLLVRYVFKPAGDEVCKYWGEQLKH